MRKTHLPLCAHPIPPQTRSSLPYQPSISLCLVVLSCIDAVARSTHRLEAVLQQGHFCNMSHRHEDSLPNQLLTKNHNITCDAERHEASKSKSIIGAWRVRLSSARPLVQKRAPCILVLQQGQPKLARQSCCHQPDPLQVDGTTRALLLRRRCYQLALLR